VRLALALASVSTTTTTTTDVRGYRDYEEMVDEPLEMEENRKLPTVRHVLALPPREALAPGRRHAHLQWGHGSDPALFMVKCSPGMEQEVAVQLMRKVSVVQQEA
jgi:hypothetical protein